MMIAIAIAAGGLTVGVIGYLWLLFVDVADAGQPGPYYDTPPGRPRDGNQMP